jgi:RNA recognition motif-containing protein
LNVSSTGKSFLKRKGISTMNIYVGNLPHKVTEDELRQAFEEFGQVTEVRLIMDKFSGESKGFGFVEMPSKDEAEKAIAEMNGKEFMGRALNVNEARPKTDRGGGGGGGRRGGFGGGRGGGGGGGGRDRSGRSGGSGRY